MDLWNDSDFLQELESEERSLHFGKDFPDKNQTAAHYWQKCKKWIMNFKTAILDKYWKFLTTPRKDPSYRTLSGYITPGLQCFLWSTTLKQGVQREIELVKSNDSWREMESLRTIKDLSAMHRTLAEVRGNEVRSSIACTGGSSQLVRPTRHIA